MNSNQEKEITRYFFDVSALHEYVRAFERYSGIQRVVATIIEHYLHIQGGENAYISFLERGFGRYKCIKLNDIDPLCFRSPASLAAAMGKKGVDGTYLAPIAKYKSSRQKYLFHRLKFDVFAALNMDRRFAKYNLNAKSWRELRRPLTKPIESVEFLDFFDLARPGDHLIVIDSSWLPKHSEMFRKAKELGLEVHTFVYDLVPVIMPHVTAGNMPNMFYNALLDSINYTSGYITISESTKADLDKFLQNKGVDIPSRSLPLAQEGLPSKMTDSSTNTNDHLVNDQYDDYAHIAEVGALRDEIRSVATIPYVLCVGSIEPRKNGWRIANAWARLSELKGIEVPRLVFAGGSGWLRTEFDTFLEGTGNLNGWVQVVDRPTDIELAFLYRNCSFTIMASIYEGWGLPVGESLAYGKTAIVSNTTSLPEVGGNLVKYCDPNSIDSIEAACKELICQPEIRVELEEKIKSTNLRSWGDVSADLISILRAS
ncbi:glycosyltransferase family 4 protein [Agrobacterium pusense]|uniref:glycosyltransferase family 4 protein n=1 Tax=Agrobacterium pusense TaxID=648995 RepID=UPI003FD5E454